MGDIATIVQIIGAVVTAMATLALAVLTRKYVILSREMLEESRVSRRASVFLDLEMRHSDVRLTVGNLGNASAQNIKIEVKDSLPWRDGLGSDGFNAISIVKHGLSYLAPGRMLKYEAGFPDWKKVAPNESVVEFTLRYESQGRQYSDQFRIDLSEYTGVLVESFRNESSEIASTLHDIERNLRHKDPGFLQRAMQKSCPFCGKGIPSSAKKCHHCHEFLNTDPKFNHPSQSTPDGGAERDR